MRTLILMRHGAAVDAEDGDDYGRALTAEGRKDVSRQAMRLVEASVPDCIIASSALRTSETALLMASFLKQELTVLLKPSLYHASANDYLALIQQQSATLKKLLIIGHNPAISALVSLLTGQVNLWMEPAAMAIVHAPLDLAWDALMVGTYTLQHYG